MKKPAPKAAFNGAPQGAAPAHDDAPASPTNKSTINTNDPPHGDGLEHEGWSGFIADDRISKQGAVPFKGSSQESIEFETRSGMQRGKK